jgi:PLP dependent protein
MSDISDRLKVIREQMSAAAYGAGREPSEVRLIAVSKSQPAELVREAFEAGQRVFAESRGQELLVKVPLLPASVCWHFIGHLQRNKIRKVLPVVELIHAVDSVELAQDIDKIAAELGLFPRVLLEVNISGESSKFGFKPEAVRSEAGRLLSLPRVQVEGFMTMAPVVERPEQAKPIFAGLRRLRDEIAAENNAGLPVLSMGMSQDFVAAIQEGATHVRIGTALFGTGSKP